MTTIEIRPTSLVILAKRHFGISDWSSLYAGLIIVLEKQIFEL